MYLKKKQQQQRTRRVPCGREPALALASACVAKSKSKIIHPSDTRARNVTLGCLSTDAGACRNIPCMSKQYYTEASAASKGKMRGKMLRFGKMRAIRDERTVRDSRMRIGHSVRVSNCLPITVISTDFETAIENLQRRRRAGKRPRKTHLYLLRNVTTLLLFHRCFTRKVCAKRLRHDGVTSRHPTNHTPRKSHPLADPVACDFWVGARAPRAIENSSFFQTRTGPIDRPTPGLPSSPSSSLLLRTTRRRRRRDLLLLLEGGRGPWTAARAPRATRRACVRAWF